VLDEDARRKGELSEILSIPRSTLLRTLKEMIEHGWVTELQNGVYETTSAGARTVDMFEGFYSQFHSLAGLTQLAQVLPPELTDCPEFRSLLQENLGYDEIRTYITTSDSPYEPMRRFAEKLRSAEIECLFLGVANPFYNNPLQDSLEDGSISELIVSRNVVDSISRRDKLVDILTKETVTVSVKEDPFRYSGFTTEQKLVIEGTGEDEMTTQVVVELSLVEDAVREWSKYIFRTSNQG